MTVKLHFVAVLMLLPISGFAQTDEVKDHEPEGLRPPAYKNNIASMSLTITDAGMTMGVAYERILDNKGIVSVYLPVAYYVKGWGGKGDIATPQTPFGEMNRDVQLLQLRPTIKFYPFNAKGKVRYAVGPQFSYEEGHLTSNIYRWGPDYTIASYSLYLKKIGVLLNNTLMMQPNKKLYLGVEFGLGSTFVNRKSQLFYPMDHSQPYISGIKEEGPVVLSHFSFNIGYRF